MSLEQALAANTEALLANTAALLAAKGTASTGTASTGTASTGETAAKTPKTPKTPKEEVVKATKTREELAAAMGAYKEKFGTPKAKEIILGTGGAEALANVSEDKIDALFAAATKAVEEAEEAL